MSKSWPRWNERQNSCHLNGALVIQPPCSRQLLCGLTPSFFTWWIVPCSRHRGAPAPSVRSEHRHGRGGLKQDAWLEPAVFCPATPRRAWASNQVFFFYFCRNYWAWTKLFAGCKLAGLEKCSIRAGLHIAAGGWRPASSNEALVHRYLRRVPETNSFHI